MRAARRALKRLGAWLLAAGLGALARRGPRGGAPARVLVIRVDERVGNVLLTSPLVAALQAGLPEARIEVLVAASKASILEGLVAQRRFDKKRVWRRPGAFLAQLWGLRRARFDVVIDASHWHHFSLTSAALTAWCGAPTRIGHARGPADRFYTAAVAAPPAPEWEVDTKLRLLDPVPGLADRSAGDTTVALRTSLGRGAAAARMDAWLAGIGLEAGFVGLAPGARKPDHRAPVELFAGVGARARGLGRACVVLWGPGEEALARDLADRCGAHVAPPTSLDELAALMRRAAVVVANDTGPMHLAVACEAPTLALFRSADPVRWGHARLGHVVIPVDGDGADEAASRARAGLERLLGAHEAP